MNVLFCERERERERERDVNVKIVIFSIVQIFFIQTPVWLGRWCKTIKLMRTSICPDSDSAKPKKCTHVFV